MSVLAISPLTTDARHKVCDQVGNALSEGKIGDIVASHEKLIMEYYGDVQRQANKSFESAQFVAKLGFYVLIGTLAYTLIVDGATRFFAKAPEDSANFMTVAVLGAISGALIEFIAAISFWLYARGARQFGAFHICLERTHRYLLAYKITEQMKDNKDITLHNLVCIMANAPMITQGDTDFRRDITKIIEPKSSQAA
jgi:hypothetical protein